MTPPIYKKKKRNETKRQKKQVHGVRLEGRTPFLAVDWLALVIDDWSLDIIPGPPQKKAKRQRSKIRNGRKWGRRYPPLIGRRFSMTSPRRWMAGSNKSKSPGQNGVAKSLRNRRTRRPRITCSSTFDDAHRCQCFVGVLFVCLFC